MDVSSNDEGQDQKRKRERIRVNGAPVEKKDHR